LQPVPKRALNRAAARPLVIAILAYALFLVLGLYVSHRPPGDLDRSARELVGHGDLAAWILTWTLYAYWLMPLCAVLIAIAIALPRWRARVAVTIATLVVTWGASDLFQRAFMRPRPLWWVVKHETASAYPSSHAALAVAFYGFWFLLLLRSELPRAVRAWGAAALGLLVAAVYWARLALGAHYPTDLGGGFLLGIVAVNVALAICLVLQVELFPGFLGD